MDLDQQIADRIMSCFYDSSDDCVKVIDTSGALKSFNTNGLKIMEIDNPGQVIGKSWLSFLKDDLNALATDAFNAALTGQPSYFEGHCPTLKGMMKYWKVSLVPITEPGGEVTSVLVTSRDSTGMLELKDKVAKLEAEVATLKADAK